MMLLMMLMMLLKLSLPMKHSTFTLGCELCASTRDERLVCMMVAVCLLAAALVGLWRVNGVES